MRYVDQLVNNIVPVIPIDIAQFLSDAIHNN